MMKKGKVVYCPPLVFEALNNIKINYNIPNQADAFKKMTDLSRTGMEVEKMSGYRFIEYKLRKKK